MPTKKPSPAFLSPWWAKIGCQAFAAIRSKPLLAKQSTKHACGFLLFAHVLMPIMFIYYGQPAKIIMLAEEASPRRLDTKTSLLAGPARAVGANARQKMSRCE